MFSNLHLIPTLPTRHGPKKKIENDIRTQPETRVFLLRVPDVGLCSRFTNKERYPDDKFRFFFKYDSFGGDSFFCPTGGVKKIVFIAIANYGVVFSKTFSVKIEAID